MKPVKINGCWIATTVDELSGITVRWVLHPLWEPEWIKLLDEQERQDELFKLLEPEE